MNLNRMIAPQIVFPPEGQPEERLNAHFLATFVCPFFDQCEFHACPFAHRPPPTERETFSNDLHPIPWYYCMDHLLQQCRSVTLRQRGSQLIRCEFGFHPKNEDLDDADQFKNRMALALLSGEFLPQIQSPNFSVCAICNTRIEGNCVILENCSHRFCIHCSNSEYHVFTVLLTRDIVCGICHTISRRLMYWPTTALSNSYRKLIFSLQRRAFGLMIGLGSQVLVSDKLVTDGQILIRFRKIGRRITRTYRLENRVEPQESPTSPLLDIDTTNEQCDICLKNIDASPERLWAYLENCPHRFCIRCLLQWRLRQAPVEPISGLQSIDFSCPTCRTEAARILIWPTALDNLHFRQFLFRVQKLCCGLNVSAKTTITVHEVSRLFEDLAFICGRDTLWVPAYSMVPSGPNGQLRFINRR